MVSRSFSRPAGVSRTSPTIPTGRPPSRASAIVPALR
uniref:Uncharacterized protein n=1 Tax=Arundo donax TaxID=35708 RepID=A0A0A9HGP0_ARUDO